MEVILFRTKGSHTQLIEGKERQAVVINQGRMIPLCVCVCVLFC
jgi:predicted RNA binding protein YcfA (HicA-like mRNA interferase family)